MLAIFNIGPLEWIVLLVGAVLLFGGDLPSVVRKLAQFLGKLRAMASEITREVDLHDRYASPPQRPQLPPPPEFGVDPGASAAPAEDGGEHDAASADEARGTQPGADDAPRDVEAAASDEPPADPEAEADPPDHSDWEDESGSDRPRDLRGD